MAGLLFKEIRKKSRTLRTAIAGILDAGLNAKERTYFPDADQKSQMEIVLDLSKWMLRHFEYNHLYFHYGLDIVGKTPKGYVSTREFMKRRDRANICAPRGRRISYISLLVDKVLFSRIMRIHGIPIPQTFGHCDAGRFERPDGERVDGIGEIIRIGTTAIAKDRFGQCAGTIEEAADGIVLIERTARGEFAINNQASTDAQAADHFRSGAWIFQQRIHQHSEVAKLNPSSVNTVRLLTIAREDGSIGPVLAILKIGKKGALVDNLWLGGMIAKVDVQTGQLTGDVFHKPSSYTPEEITRIKSQLTGMALPHWQDVVAAAKSAHLALTGIRSVGWDIAITQDGAVVIEGNDNWGLSLFQVFGGMKHLMDSFGGTNVGLFF